MGGCGCHMGIGNGAWMKPCGYQAGNVGNVHHQICARLISNLPKPLKINGSGISAGACNDKLGLALKSQTADLLIVQYAVIIYAIGYYLGNKIYDGSIKWIDQQQMAKTQAFFAKHGKLTIVLARFVPIIRSFAPLVAGAAKMNRLNFEVSGTVGAVLWAGIILSAGHLFGNIPLIKDNLSLILVGGIVLGLAPFVIGYIVKKWRQHPDPKN